MINNILREGDRIEISELQTAQENESGEMKKSYASQILELKESGNIRISMPFYKGRLIPLNKGVKYDAFFYTSKGLYYCRVELVERYKTGNIYVAEIEQKTELQKFQRRQYYRLEKSLDIMYTEINEKEYLQIVSEHKVPDRINTEDGQLEIYNKGTTLDISGGGLRFVGRKRMEMGQKVYLVFYIRSESYELVYRIPAMVIAVFELPTDNRAFEHRVEFQNISRDYRERLIRYIFEEERKSRQLTR